MCTIVCLFLSRSALAPKKKKPKQAVQHHLKPKQAVQHCWACHIRCYGLCTGYAALYSGRRQLNGGERGHTTLGRGSSGTSRGRRRTWCKTGCAVPRPTHPWASCPLRNRSRRSCQWSVRPQSTQGLVNNSSEPIAYAWSVAMA